VAFQNPKIQLKMTGMMLIRSATYPLTKIPPGWAGMTGNMNDGRGGDFLYVVYK